MGFDIFFITCNFGTRKKRIKHPVTHKPVMMFDDPGLTAPERAGVLRLLKQMKAQGPDSFGIWRIAFPTGGQIDFYASDLVNNKKCTGIAVETWSLGPSVARLVFKLSRIGNMLIYFPGAETVGELVTSGEQKLQVAVRHPHAKLVRSAVALEKELRRGFGCWENYREQVVREDE